MSKKPPYTVPFIKSDEVFSLNHFEDYDVVDYVIKHFNQFAIELQYKLKKKIKAKKIRNKPTKL